jgi:hypothetical protein
MTDPINSPKQPKPAKAMAGGFFIMLTLLAGSIIGIIYDEPSLGMVIGFGVGVLLAVGIWLIDSRKN